MKIHKGIMAAIIVIGLLMGTFSVVQAVPPLPSSFHGTVMVNGANVPEGTSITAWINGTQYAQTNSLMYAGDSVYAIDVPGDDSSTPGIIEGGKPGDIIVFKIDGVTADQTATWTSGTYPTRDLSAQVITVTADAKSKTYGHADPVFTYTYLPNTPSVTFTGALGRETGENVGAYAITIGTLSAPGYTIIFNSANLTINPKPIMVTADARSKTYGQVDPVLTYQTAPSLVTGDSFTGGLARLGGEKVGEYPILQGTLAINDGNNGANYNITYASADLTINKRAIAITADNKSKIVGNPDPALTYTITTGSLAFEDKITGALARDAGETIGSYPIRQGTLAIDDGNGGLNYDLNFNNGTLTISQLSLTITAQPATKVYGEADPVFTYVASDPSVPLTGALSRVIGENVGTYAINIGTLSAGDQYGITFVPANLTITKKSASVTPEAATKIYGAADPSFTGTLSGFLPADNVTATYSRVAGETVAGGPYAISAVLSPTAVLGNYDVTYNTANFTITKKSASVTPDAETKVYGAADPSLTGTLSGFLTADNVTATYSRIAGETVAGGPYAISAVLSPTAALENYDITYNTANFTITKKSASVTPNVATKVYGAADPSLTGTLTGFLTADGVTATYSRIAGEAVAGSPYTISAVLSPTAVLGNYEVTYSTADFNITPKQITVTADEKSKTYGLPDPALGYVVVGLVEDDQLTGSLIRLPGENVGTYQITIGTLTAGSNYTIAYVPNLLTISQRAIAITADDKAKVVGDPDPALTYSITSGSLAYTDIIAGALVRDAGETIGSYPIRQGTVAIDDGNGGLNYDLSFNNGTLTISQLSLTITAQAATKVYGEADPVFTYIASDPSVPLTGALSRVTGENVGTYAITIGTLSAGDQYGITFVPANLTITKKAASVTPEAATKVYGAADPSFTGTLTGFLPADDVTATYSRVAGETVAGGPYAISAVLNPTAVLGNYNITYNTANFTITKKSASVTPDAATKIYGAADPDFSGTLTGFLTADGVTAAYSRIAGETVSGGPYTISAVLSPTAALENYEITYNTANFTITKKSASVTPDAATKIYGAADPSLTGMLTGFLPADGVTAVYSRITGETVAGSPYTISAVLNPAAVLENYDVTYNTADFTITPKQITVTANENSKVYGLPDPALSYVVVGLVADDQLTGSLIRLPGENVGTYQITIGTLTAGSNYTIAYVPNLLTISQRAIAITADDKVKLVGDPDPALTYTITTGSLAFEDEITGALARDAGETIGSYPIRQGTLAIDDGNEGLNYDLSFNNGTLTISQLTLTITAQPATKVYGEADPVFTYVASDPSVPLTGALSRETGENVGVYAITIGTLSAGDEYAIIFVSDDFTITPRPITITADDKEKIEGELDPELTFGITSGSLVFEDEIVGELEREPGELAGLYDILIGSLQINDGNDGDNYAITYIKGSFTILQGTGYIYLPLIFK